MRILLVSTQDYIHHPLPSRHHHIFEELATRHEVHVPHFHLHEGKARKTRLYVHEATMFNVQDPALHYILNAPYHYHIFKKIIRDEKIDVVVAAHVLAGLAAVKAAKKYNVPVLFDLKDWFPDSAAAYYKNPFMKYVLEKGVWRITKHALDGADMITTVSPNLVDKLRDFGYRPTLITNGVDTDVFKPMDMGTAKEGIGFKQEDFIIGFAGAIERWFALEDVIRNVAELMSTNKNIKLVLLGKSLFTNYDKELKKLVQDLGVENNVLFVGLVEYAKQPLYIAAMDVCLIPLASAEWGSIALPNKFFEYSACGKPILSSFIPALEGAKNVTFYHGHDGFIAGIEKIKKNGPRTIYVDVASWKDKAKEMEKTLEILIDAKKTLNGKNVKDFFRECREMGNEW